MFNVHRIQLFFYFYANSIRLFKFQYILIKPGYSNEKLNGFVLGCKPVIWTKRP